MLSDSADLIPQGARERIAAALWRFGARAALRPMLSPKIPITWQRHWMRQLARFTPARRDVERQAGIVGGIAGEWMRPRGADGAIILYFHGGGYCVGSPKSHRAITSHLAQAARLDLFAPAYRLAPEHPFPAALDDAIACYRALCDSGPVVLAGESAGGGLALAIALAARQRDIEGPAALVLFSPWTDLAASAVPAGAPDDAMLRADWLRACADHYLAGRSATAPLASPLHGDLAGLPPTLIQAGADELLCDQAVRTHDALLAGGCAVRCEIVPGRWHAFQLLGGALPSADAAITRAGAFIRQAVGG